MHFINPLNTPISKKMKKILTFVILVSLALTATSQRSLNKKLERLDVYFEQALEDWDVPGMAVAIVRDD